MNKIKWVKFFTTGVPAYQTYFTDTKTVQDDGEVSEFTDATDAVSKSTDETFIFWDNEPVGPGKLQA